MHAVSVCKCACSVFVCDCACSVFVCDCACSVFVCECACSVCVCVSVHAVCVCVCVGLHCGNPAPPRPLLGQVENGVYRRWPAADDNRPLQSAGNQINTPHLGARRPGHKSRPTPKRGGTVGWKRKEREGTVGWKRKGREGTVGWKRKEREERERQQEVPSKRGLHGETPGPGWSGPSEVPTLPRREREEQTTKREGSSALTARPQAEFRSYLLCCIFVVSVFLLFHCVS